MKRTISWILCAVMMLCMLPAAAYADSIQFNPWKAASWARDSANVNDSNNGKCATFVRKALKYGGLTNIGSISVTDDLKDFLVNNGYGAEYAVNDTNLNIIRPGDVVEVYGSSGIKHVIIVTEVNQGSKYIRYSARNNNHCNEKMSFSTLKSYHNSFDGGKSTKFIHMNDTVQRSSSVAVRVYQGEQYHCYERFDYNLSWSEAKAFCEQRGGHLVTITDQAENDFIVNNVLAGCPLGYYHIGLSTPTVESQAWSWVTPESYSYGYSYDNWDPDAPEPSKGSGEYYAAIIGYPWPNNKQIGEWIDELDNGTGFYCPENGGFICEQETLYTVHYNANGGGKWRDSDLKDKWVNLTLDSEIPTHLDSSAGSYTVTLSANGGSVNPGSLSAARTTKYTFRNYNTHIDGSGTTYYPGGIYSRDEDVTLYAQWDSLNTTAAVTLPTPTREGHSFLGWSTDANAATGQYQAGASYTPGGDTTLYAIWKADDTAQPVISNVVVSELSPTGYTVTCDVSDDKGVTDVRFPTWTVNNDQDDIVPWPWEQGTLSNGKATFRVNVSTHNNEKACYYRTHIYAYDAAGNYVVYVVDDVYVPADSTTVTYDSVGGTPTPDTQTKYFGTPLTLSAVVPTHLGYTFLGWATSADAETAQYQPGAVCTEDADLTLYALWRFTRYENSLKLPAALVEIETEAFSGLPIQEVVLPESVESVGKKAFADCTGLRLAEFNVANASIASDAFSNCPNVIFFAPGGGTVQAFAEWRNIPFIAK